MSTSNKAESISKKPRTSLAKRIIIPSLAVMVATLIGLSIFQNMTSSKALLRSLKKDHASYKVVLEQMAAASLQHLSDMGREIVLKDKEMLDIVASENPDLNELEESYARPAFNVLNTEMGGILRRIVFCDANTWKVRFVKGASDASSAVNPGDDCRSPVIEAGVAAFIKEGANAKPVQGYLKVGEEIVLTRFFPVTRYDRKKGGSVLKNLVRIDIGVEPVVEGLKRTAGAQEALNVAAPPPGFDAQGDTATATANFALGITDIHGKSAGHVLLKRNISEDLEELDSQLMQQIGILIVAFILLTATLVFLIRQRISAPIRSLSEAMGDLAQGNTDLAVPGTDREDELRLMADAVQIFKDSAIEKARLEVQQAEDQAKAEEEKRRAIHDLAREVGGLAEEAGAGDLSVRLSLDGKEGDLLTLSGSLNGLVEIVEKGIGETIGVLSALAQGDLTKRMEGAYQGAFERLKSDSNATSERLSQIVGDISKATGEVQMASAEIAEGSGDLSSRTEQQASSLEQTSAAMEQLVATVRQNADNSKLANQLSITARGAAEQGGEIVSSAVQSMSGIEEASRQITDIVNVIDEIAFQTNLLALNAAVEAARAGEAGKGFAVVASEVRALAQRSGEASKEIKSMIDNSNSQIKHGVELVNEAGETLDGIVTAIKQVADIVSEINSASQEQAAGLDEINAAVVNMDEMTQQNSALVEQTTAAAQSLDDQARTLAGLVGYFNIGGEQAAAAAPPSAPKSPQRSRAPAAAGAGEDGDWQEF